ncbi:hypothetical protein GGH94_005236 [Coemansia aciculifera]|uniref:Uncharacterized protein n=1 Tax=Coemansia aciculifera TaxID=417176 RepID=A0A9W8IMR3_9FUNG|nr:hypothetical protein GGH94_005236 [Coemansia aciculifera]KAJ2872081.1 hypothetical protein GGH93_004312 [Coemansia aciculifera]
MFSAINLVLRRSQTAVRVSRILPYPRLQFARTLTSIVPKNLQPTADEFAQASIMTKTGTYDINTPPQNVRSDVWSLVVSTIMRIDPKNLRQPKKSVLHWLLQHAENREELDVALDLMLHWRMHMLPITQATTQIWAEACIRLEEPDLFVTMLMDRWKYRQLPINYNMARFIKYLGGRNRLDDAFRLFALYPFYGLSYDAQAYGALVEACCAQVGDEQAWRRALVASEEALANDPPLITLEALRVLESRSTEHNEQEMAQRYKSLADNLPLQPTSKEAVKFDEDGNHLN